MQAVCRVWIWLRIVLAGWKTVHQSARPPGTAAPAARAAADRPVTPEACLRHDGGRYCNVSTCTSVGVSDTMNCQITDVAAAPRGRPPPSVARLSPGCRQSGSFAILSDAMKRSIEYTGNNRHRGPVRHNPLGFPAPNAVREPPPEIARTYHTGKGRGVGENRPVVRIMISLCAHEFYQPVFTTIPAPLRRSRKGRTGAGCPVVPTMTVDKRTGVCFVSCMGAMTRIACASAHGPDRPRADDKDDIRNRACRGRRPGPLHGLRQGGPNSRRKMA